MFARNDFYFRLQLPLIIIHITCISLSLHRTSAPIHLRSVLGVLGTQETSCILIAGLLERDIFDLFLPEFDKPWVIHLRETYCCCTNLCTWRPNTVYKNISVRRYQLHNSLFPHHKTSVEWEVPLIKVNTLQSMYSCIIVAKWSMSPVKGLRTLAAHCCPRSSPSTRRSSEAP
jgi:hypothetical protein